MIKDIKQRILLSRHLVLREDTADLSDKDRAFYNSYLWVNLGFTLTNPELLNRQVFETLSQVFPLVVPPSFYENPQDTALFSTDELLLEQLVSYYLGYGTKMGRVELFQKTLSKYVTSSQTKKREYRIIDKAEADKIFKDLMNAFCQYKRPFGTDEEEEFLFLYQNGYFTPGTKIACKDNIFHLLEIDPSFATQLDKKDVVKYSLNNLNHWTDGLSTRLERNQDIARIIRIAIPLVKDCPMSKKQAKFFNTLCKKLYINVPRESNKNTPHARAIALIKEDKILEAAEIYAKSGSLLLRNLVFLVSRANEEDTRKILDMVKDDNGIVLLQLYNGIKRTNTKKPRTFRFYSRNYMKVHTETGYETKCRKTMLNKERKNLLLSLLKEKIISHYEKAPKLGKIYISDQFDNVAVPFNTTASGGGIDILPIGSRIHFEGDFIRTFVYWNNVFDIDASAFILRKSDLLSQKEFGADCYLSWRTYAQKPFHGFALSSGDCTSITGSEYQDYDINGLLSRKYAYVVYCLNGYAGPFGDNDVHAGIQIKDALDNAAWDPKNIEFQMDVKGECRAFTAFGIDLERREIIILNTKTLGQSILFRSQLDSVLPCLYLDYLDFNMKNLLSLRGEVVDNPEEAEIVFDAEYNPKEGQKVIRPFDISKLVEIINN